MRVGIVGSRNFPDLEQVREYVRALPADTTIVSGGARGVDRTAAEEARAMGFEVIEIPPTDVVHVLENAYGVRGVDFAFRDLAFTRNTMIVLLSERVVAFTTGTPGTADSIAQARRLRRPLETYGPR